MTYIKHSTLFLIRQISVIIPSCGLVTCILVVLGGGDSIFAAGNSGGKQSGLPSNLVVCKPVESERDFPTKTDACAPEVDVAPMNGSTDDGIALSRVRAKAHNSATIRVQPGTLHPASPISGGPPGPILWQLDGNCFDLGCKAPVISLGSDTVENYFDGTKYIGRLRSSRQPGAVLRVDGALTHHDGSGPIPVFQVNGTLGDPSEPGGVFSAFPWVSLVKLDIMGSGGAGQSVAAYNQVNRFSQNAGMFGTVAEVSDLTGGGSSYGGAHIVEESDLTANGPDNGTCNSYGCRIMHDDVIATANVIGVTTLRILRAGAGGRDGVYTVSFDGGAFAASGSRAAPNRQARGHCVLRNGSVKELLVDDQGAGYTSAPKVTCNAPNLQKFAASASLGSLPPAVGTIYRIGGRDGSQHIGAYVRLVNQTPVDDAMIDTTQGVLKGKSSAIKVSNCQNLADLSGEGTHLLSFCDGALHYRSNGKDMLTADDGGGLRPPSYQEDPDRAHSSSGAIYFNSSLRVLRQFDGTVWSSVGMQAGTPSPDRSCSAGHQMYDENYIYVCVAVRGAAKWRRSALAPF